MSYARDAPSHFLTVIPAKVWVGAEDSSACYEVLGLIKFCTWPTGAVQSFRHILQVAKRTGAVIEVIPETADNDIDIEALEHSIQHGGGKPVLLAFTHIPTNSGQLGMQECLLSPALILRVG
jgi:selenocysteine lyase/cysteine desulfurase